MQLRVDLRLYAQNTIVNITFRSSIELSPNKDSIPLGENCTAKQENPSLICIPNTCSPRGDRDSILSS